MTDTNPVASLEHAAESLRLWTLEVNRTERDVDDLEASLTLARDRAHAAREGRAKAANTLIQYVIKGADNASENTS